MRDAPAYFVVRAGTRVIESWRMLLSLLIDDSLSLAVTPLASRVHFVCLATLVVLFTAESAAARTRTWDNHVNSVVLYHLSYGGRHSGVVGVI